MGLVVHLLLFLSVLVEQRDHPGAGLPEKGNGESGFPRTIRHAGELGGDLAEENSGVLEMPGRIDG